MLLLVALNGAKSQTWAPIGAQWHYESQYFFQNKQGFFHFESIKDTIVSGKICKQIKAYHSYSCIRKSSFPIFTYESNDSVFILNYADTANPNWQLHYKWDAKTGDSWLMVGLGPFFPPTMSLDSFILKVDSIDILTINGQALRRLFVHQLELDSTVIGVGGIIIEKIGDPYYMFSWERPDGWCDEEYPVSLRCYEDNVIGLYMPIPSDSCDQIKDYTGIKKLNANISITEVYPNPCFDFLNVKTDINGSSISIIDQYGHNVTSMIIEETDIVDLSNITSGIYLVTINSSQGIERHRIVKR